MNDFKTGLDLTKQPPRSPRATVGGFMILGRTIDKCRALLFGKIGEYHFDCPLDNQLFRLDGHQGRRFQGLRRRRPFGRRDCRMGPKEGRPKTDTEVSE